MNCSVSLPQFVVLAQTPLKNFFNGNPALHLSLSATVSQLHSSLTSLVNNCIYVVVSLICCCVYATFRACVSLASKNRIIGNAAKSQVRRSFFYNKSYINTSLMIQIENVVLISFIFHIDVLILAFFHILDHNKLQKYSPWL